MPSGSLSSARLEQPWNAPDSMAPSFSGSAVSARPTQPENAWWPMAVTPSGSLPRVRLVQPWNAEGPTVARPSGRARLTSSPNVSEPGSVPDTSFKPPMPDRSRLDRMGHAPPSL